MTKKYQSIYTTFSPPQSLVSLRVNIMTEEIYGWKYEKSTHKTDYFPLDNKLENLQQVYQFVKDNDDIGYWLIHYHNLFASEDGTYLENMFYTLRRRYKKPFNNFF